MAIAANIFTPNAQRTSTPDGRHLWVASGIAVLNPPFIGGPGADANPGAWRRIRPWNRHAPRSNVPPSSAAQQRVRRG
jgi:hypothetical protein